MADRPIDAKVEPTTPPTEEELANAKLVEDNLKKIELKKKVMEVYDRGIVGDRLHVDLPPDLVGQWVPRDNQSVYRMETLGYQIDKEYAPKRRLHDGGDGAAYVGDVVFMTAPKYVREAIDEVKKERYQRINAPKGGKQKEEKDFEAQQQQVSSAGIGTIVGSKVHSVESVNEIKEAIK